MLPRTTNHARGTTRLGAVLGQGYPRDCIHLSQAVPAHRNAGPTYALRPALSRCLASRQDGRVIDRMQDVWLLLGFPTHTATPWAPGRGALSSPAGRPDQAASNRVGPPTVSVPDAPVPQTGPIDPAADARVRSRYARLAFSTVLRPRPFGKSFRRGDQKAHTTRRLTRRHPRRDSTETLADFGGLAP